MVWDVSPVFFSIGPLAIRYYSLLFALTFLGGLQLWRWQVLRAGHGIEKADAFFWYGVVAVVAGARLGHVFFYEWHVYREKPLHIFYVWEGGLASHGATVGLVLALWLFSRRHRMPLLDVLDRFSFSAAFGAFMVRIGNFFNSEVVGRATDVSWCMRFPRSVEDRGLPLEMMPCRHPSQLYEVALGLAVLLALWLVDRRLREDRPRGLLAALFLLLYFSGRFIVEFFKEYQGLDPAVHPLTEGQYLSIPFIVAGALLMRWALRNGRVASSRPPALETDSMTTKNPATKRGGKKRRRK